jgi:hypothetical protein
MTEPQLEDVETGCPAREFIDFQNLELPPVGAVSRREYGTGAMYGIYDRIAPHFRTMRKSGIVGNAAHLSGYHRSRKALLDAGRVNDYSIQAPADKDGPELAAAAIDISYGPDEMKRVTRRLMDACRPDGNGNYDPRIECVREFFGTLDGRNVTGWNRYRTNRPVGYVTADKSHLWHIHISIFRRYVDDKDKMRALADVIAGIPATQPLTPTPAPQEDDLPTPEEVWKADILPNNGVTGNTENKTVTPVTFFPRLWERVGAILTQVKNVGDQQLATHRALDERLERIERALADLGKPPTP